MNNLLLLKRLKLVILSFVLLIISCGKHDLDETSFDFIIEVNLYPEQKQYNIGDTINISYVIEDYFLKDTKSDKKFKIENGVIPFYLNAETKHIDSNLNNTFEVFSYEINGVPKELIKEELDGQHLFLQYKLGCGFKDNNYKIDIKIVLRKKGIYKIELPDNLLMRFGKEYNCNDFEYFCDFGNLSYRFSVDDSNSDILKRSPYSSNISIPDDNTERKTNLKEIFWIEVLD